MKLTPGQRKRRNALLREFRDAMNAAEYGGQWSVKMSELFSIYGIPLDEQSLRNYAAMGEVTVSEIK